MNASLTPHNPTAVVRHAPIGATIHAKYLPVFGKPAPGSPAVAQAGRARRFPADFLIGAARPPGKWAIRRVFSGPRRRQSGHSGSTSRQTVLRRDTTNICLV